MTNEIRMAALGAILGVFLNAPAVRAQAPPPQCSQATLSGTYVISGTGSLGSASAVMMGKVAYDGQGNGQATFTQSAGGVITRYASVPGVYTVNPDCTGSKIFGGTISYDFVVTPDGREISWIVTNSPTLAVFTGHAVRLDSSGDIHVTKECSQYQGQAGGFCTITSSNFAAIKVGSKVVYEQDQTANPSNVFSTDVYLDAGPGNMAVGHCTLDAGSFGLCTFADGTGQFAGFQARVSVSPFSSSPTEVNYHWDGKYSFNPK